MKRIQKPKSLNWEMPENAVFVGFGSKWDSPWKVKKAPNGEWVVYRPPNPDPITPTFETEAGARKAVNARYRAMIEGRKISLVELYEKDLVCTCPPDQLCHADVLIALCQVAMAKPAVKPWNPFPNRDVIKAALALKGDK